MKILLSKFDFIKDSLCTRKHINWFSVAGIYKAKGKDISRKDKNEYIETFHLAPTQFSHLPGFYCKFKT